MIAHGTPSAGDEGRINVSDEIREYLRQHPDAKPSEIAVFLESERQVNVKPSYMSNIKSRESERRQTAATGPTVHKLVRARRFCEEMGGVEQALDTIRTWAALTRNS